MPMSMSMAQSLQTDGTEQRFVFTRARAHWILELCVAYFGAPAPPKKIPFLDSRKPTVTHNLA